MMPDGIRNGSATTDKPNDGGNFLSFCGEEGGDGEDGDDQDDQPLLPTKHPVENGSRKLVNVNNLNFDDLFKTGTMAGDKNGNSGGPANAPRLRLSSSSRDSDFVILVLNQKQREDDEVQMLLDRLQDKGVSCLYMKNGGSNNNGAKSPIHAPLEPTGASPFLPLSPEKAVVQVQSPNSPVKNGRIPNLPFDSNMKPKDSHSHSSSPFSENGALIAPLPLPLPCPSLTLDLSLPLRPSVPLDLCTEKSTADFSSSSPFQSPLLALKETGLAGKKKRKRRKKYPYLIRKVPKRKKPISVDELITVLDSDIAASSQDACESESESPSVPVSGPEVLVKYSESESVDADVNERRSESELKEPELSVDVDVDTADVPKPPKWKLKLKSPFKIKSKSKPKKGSGGLRGRKRGPFSSSAKIISRRRSSTSSNQGQGQDPYAFIPERDEEEPLPLKLFSPTSPRKNGFVVAESSSTNRIKEEPSEPSELPKSDSETAENSDKLEPLATANVSDQEQDNSLPKVKKRKKRSNEVCQLLTWAVQPRPSTPRSTGITAFFPREKVPSGSKVESDSQGLDKPMMGDDNKETTQSAEPSAEAITEPEVADPSGSELSQLASNPETEEFTVPVPVPNHSSLSVIKEEEPSKPQSRKPIIKIRLRGGKIEKKRKKKKNPWYKKKPKLTAATAALGGQKSDSVLLQNGEISNDKEEDNRRNQTGAEDEKEKDSENSILVPEETAAVTTTAADPITARPATKEEIPFKSASSESAQNDSVSVSNMSEVETETEQSSTGESDKKPSFTASSESVKDPDLGQVSAVSTNEAIVVPTSVAEIKMDLDSDLKEEGITETPVKQEHTTEDPSGQASSSSLQQPSSSSSTETVKAEPVFKVPAPPPPLPTKSQFLDTMQLRRPSFYSQIAGNVRNNMENFLDGRPEKKDSDVEKKTKRRRRPRARNGFLLHHGDIFPEDPEAPYKLHLATQILLKLNKRRAKYKPKEDKGKSLLSYLKLVPKRASRTSKASSSASPSDEAEKGSSNAESRPVEDESCVFSGEWTQPRWYVCNICGQVEQCFWDMVHHKGEIHPGVVVTHVELSEPPPDGFREPRSPPAVPASAILQPVPPCTKCNATFTTYPDLHMHIFECAGNTAWLSDETKDKEEVPSQRKKRKRKRGFNSFKRRLSNTPKKCNPRLKIESSTQKRRATEVFKCEFCTREFKTEGWLKNHLTTHSLPISIPLDKLKQSLPTRASSTSGRRSLVQTFLANGNFAKKVVKKAKSKVNKVKPKNKG